MVVAYPPFFPSQILDDAGQPVANGRVLAYYAGSDVPAPLFSPDGTALGSSVTLNSSGEAVFCLRAGTAYKLTCLDAQGATVWTRENVKVTTADSGMANPMEAEGDIIVGGPDGQPDRLAIGSDGDALQVVNGALTYAPATGDHKVLGDVGDNSPDVLKEKLIALAPLSKDVLNAAGNKMVRFQLTKGTDGQALKTYTDGGQLKVGWRDDEDGKVSVDGTDTAGYLEDKVVAGTGVSVTKSGGQLVVAATGADTNEVKTSATDDHPGYLQSKVLAGDLIKVEKEQTPDGDGGYTEDLRVHLDARGVTAGYVPTADGSNGAAWAAPAAQPGDHHVVVTGADASAGTLADKLVAGSNVTLTPVTDGDGVQTLEIAATGGGGGGGRQIWTSGAPSNIKNGGHGADNMQIVKTPIFPPFETVAAVGLMPYRQTTGDAYIVPTEMDLAIYEGDSEATAVKVSAFTFSGANKPASWTDGQILWFDFDAPVNLDLTKNHYLATTSKCWAGVSGSWRYNWVLTAHYTSGDMLPDAVKANMTFPKWGIGSSIPAALPDNYSSTSGSSSYSNGEWPFVCLCNKPMHS